MRGNICQTLSLSMSLFLAVLTLFVFLRMANTQLLNSRGGCEGWWQSFFRPKVWPGWAVWHCAGKVWSIHSWWQERGEVGRHCGFTALKFCRNASVNSYLVLIATDVSFYSGRVFPKTYDGTPKGLKNRSEVL